MSIKEILYTKKYMSEVLHTTLNPNGPGAMRIHLVPSKFSFFKAKPSIVILNGKDIIPLNTAWAILFSIFIREVNKYEGRAISKKEIKKIIKETVEKTRGVYRKAGRIEIREDLQEMIETFMEITINGKTERDIGQMTIGEYAPNMVAPLRMDLMISSMIRNEKWNCNQKCLHCYAAGQRYSEMEELSTEEWKKVIDVCKKNYISQVTFTGGEPTMRKDLAELIDYAKWFVTRLNTNGVLLTKKLCKDLYKASLDNVQVTLYSSDAQVHNELVGANNFDKTIEGIKNAIDAGLNVSINTPLCKINKEYIETLKFLKDLGITYVTCSGLIVTGNAEGEKSKKTQLSKTEITKLIKEAKKFADENEMEIAFTSPGWIDEAVLRKLKMDVPSCGAGLSNMAIAPNGEVVLCQSWLSDEGVGNILEVDWKRIWNNPRCKKQRNFARKSEFTCPLKKGECK